jgi:hypothetical protein
MADYTGTVEKVFKKNGTNRNGKAYTLYSARVTGVEQWVSFGFKDPGINEGDIIKVRGNVDGNSIKVEQFRVEGKDDNFKAPPPKSYGGGGGGFKGGGARDEYFKEKEKHDREEREPRIQYQSARKDALAFIAVLAEQDALPITAASGKGNKAKRYEELEEILDKLTVRFYNDILTLRVLEKVQDETPTEKVTQLPDNEPVIEEQEDNPFDNEEEVPF